MVETGERMGKKMVALITDMDQPLGMHVGNALEVIEVLEVLRGGGPEDLRELCLELAAWMFLLGGVGELRPRQEKAKQIISSGQALEKFRQMTALQGGDIGAIDDPKRLPQAQFRADVFSPAYWPRFSDSVRAGRHRFRDSRRRARAQGRFSGSRRWNCSAQKSRRQR